MDAIIKNDLHGAVFLYGGFWDDFLPSLDDAIYDQVKRQVNSSLLKFEDSRWSFDYTRFVQCDEETVTCAPLAELLNAIGLAVHATHPGGVQDQFRPEYRSFSGRGNTCIKGDYPSDTGIKPNLVTAERNWNHAAHWGDVEMVVECQSLSDQDSQNEASFQLARCARSIFSDQIFRLHVFGVAICGSIATFVRFDRSGLLHSPDIDLSTGEGANLFFRRMISLLALPAKDFGYDPRYIFRRNDKGHLETLFAMDGHPPRVVSDLLCHRKCCRGRATLASCLAAAATDCQVPPPVAGSTLAQRFLDREIVHKKIWRKEDRMGEGTTLGRFKGVFAVCQVIDFQDEVYDTRLQYPNLLDYSRAAPRFIPTVAPSSPTHTETSASTTVSTTESNEGSDTGPISDLVPIATGGDTDIKISQSEQPSNPTSECKDDDELVPSPTSLPRETRFESDLLMPKGRPLLGAQSALHVLYAMHDALLGKNFPPASSNDLNYT
ncbi:hypothetical protein FS749_008540 [Ceratobasidium sp. UAMH 11750]|nr:hypothetical protein FS749_008540 [Ceratobasidium sp. UAMH 11750]